MAAPDTTGELLAQKGPPYRIFNGSAGRGSIPNRDRNDA